MKIIIIGAGRVGSSVAEALVSEANDITVIDTDGARVAELQNRFDLRGLVGNAALPSTLAAGGAGDADILIAVTAFDETNLVACKIAADLFNIPTRIARVRNAELQQHPKLTGEGGFGATHVIFPEQTVTDYLLKLVDFPEALQVLEFADGRASLIAVRAFAGGPLVSQPIKELRRHIPNVDTRIVALFREDASVRVDGDTMILPGDEVFFLAASRNVRAVMNELRRMDKPVRTVLIAGGGNIGLRFARALATGEGLDVAQRCNVKIIETNKRRAEQLAQQLSGALVLLGDGTDEDLLLQEGVADVDLFVALTNDDENNIMSSLLAKKLGARRVIALINRKSYGDLMQGGQIDVAISPSYVTMSALLRFARRGDVVVAHTLRRAAAEALELIVHGDARSSRVIGKTIEQVEMPRGAIIGAIVRGLGDQAEVLMAHHDVAIQAEDHLIIFVENKRIIPRVEKMFTVGIGFF
ncbi:MAG: Trk system potassium transporter TrkA [Burkholderiaceae bacterium]|nr:Trk system potassium transporter TrkA [Burkholderiaceae bacterium]